LHEDYIWRSFMNMAQRPDRLSEILRRLTPQQEKVVRLYFGLGCKRSHSVAEMAEEFGVSSALVTDILGEAEKELAKVGITAKELQAVASAAAGRPNPRHRHRRPG
jgi:DNA-directed RNA polymerase sigma subunit (sigma70/sigma32)